MKFKADTREFNKALGQVSSVISQSSLNDIFENVLVEVKGKELSMTGSDNGRVQVTTVCELKSSDAKSKVAFAVKANKLKSIVGSILESDGVECSYTEKKLNIKSSSGHFVSNLITRNADEFPLLEIDDAPDLKVQLGQAELVDKLRRLQPAISKQAHRVFLTGAFFDFKGGRLQIVATDGHRLATDVIDTDFKEEASFILPHKAVDELVRLGEPDGKEEIELRATQGKTPLTYSDGDAMSSQGFRTSEFVFSGQKITLRAQNVEGSFPDYHRVIPDGETNKIHLVFDRASLDAGVRQACTVHDRSEDSIKMVSKSGVKEVELFGEGTATTDHAEVAVQLAEGNGADGIECQINSKYMQEMLGSFDGFDRIDMAFKDGQSSLLCSPHGIESGLRYVVMPVR